MHFLFLVAFWCFFTENSYATFTVNRQEEERVFPSHSPEHKRARSSVEPQLEEFSNKLQQATQLHNAFRIKELYEEFQKLSLTEKQWETAAEIYKAQKWPHQTRWKLAVGSYLFLQASFNEPHQHLLQSKMRPLFAWAVGEGFPLEEAYAETRVQVHHLIRKHPYLRRRSALFALTCSAELQHPLARLFLTEALHCFYEDFRASHKKAKRGWADERFCQKAKLFMQQSHSLAKLGIWKAQGSLRRFMCLERASFFVDLEGEALKDPIQLKQKAKLGIPRYYILLAYLYKAPGKSISNYTDEALEAAIDYHARAGEQGDFEGYNNAADLIYSAWSQHRLYEGEKKNIYSSLASQYKRIAAWLGSEQACSTEDVAIEMEEKGIPGSPQKIFESCQQLLQRNKKANVIYPRIWTYAQLLKTSLETIWEEASLERLKEITDL